MKALALFFPLMIYSAACAAENIVSDSGSVDRLQVGNGWLSLKTDIVIPTKDWKNRFTLSGAGAPVIPSMFRKSWKTILGESDGIPIEIEQSARQLKGKVVIDLMATARRDADIEGVIFTLDIPAGTFAGGIYAAGTELGDLPLKLPELYHLASANTAAIAFADASHSARIKAEFDNYAQVQIQDSRNWSDTFTVFVFIHAGAMKRGESSRLKIALWADGQIDEQTANLKVYPTENLYQVAGMGGSYCFGSHSAISRYTLDNIPVSFSRTGISLARWQPQPGGSTEGNDRPDSELHHEFEMMRELSARKIPYVASIWDLPVWLYDGGKTTESGNDNKVPRALWPDLCNSICGYLTYAKRNYQAEPAYFSFNEPDGGVRVSFSAEEHRDFIAMLGAQFAQQNLNTKILLGDVANPRTTLGYPIPASTDLEAMKYVGALSLHTWGGADPQQYRQWSDLSKRLKLPLFISEAGPDPDFKSKPFFRPYAYVDEMVHYQQIFLYAQPQAVVYWEYSDNYPLLKSDGRTPPKFALTERLCLQKHWCEFIPPESNAHRTASDNTHILFTAFSHKDSHGKSLSLHVANPDWPRKAVITGIPECITSMNAVRTAKDEYFKSLEAVPVVNGTATLYLPAQSLTTLTTQAVPDLPAP